MVYFIYGNQNIRIKSQTKAIVKKSLPECDEMNFVRFDGTQVSIQDCVYEANSMPLGYDFKVVVVENCYFLGKEKTKTKIESEQDYDALLSYLKDPNPDCDLILTLASTEINLKSDIYKALSAEPHKIIEIKEPTPKEWDSVVKVACERANVKIDYEALKELANRTVCDYGLLSNNLNKLCLYTDHITLEDVLLNVARPLEDNSFQLFNYLMNGQNMKALGLYRDLKVSNINPVTLLSLLAGQFRLLDEVLYLMREGYSTDDAAKELGIKPIRVSIMAKYKYDISQEEIKNTLEALFILDKNIKSGQIDRDYGFELFLINFKLN